MSRIDIEKLRSQLSIQNTEVTDPRIPSHESRVTNPESRIPNDEYIPPQETEKQTLSSPFRWFSLRFAKKRELAEANTLIAKIPLLANAPDIAIQYFFDKDLTRLVELGQKYPKEIHPMLRNVALRFSNKNLEPWIRLIQIACGDMAVFALALDSLC